MEGRIFMEFVDLLSEFHQDLGNDTILELHNQGYTCQGWLWYEIS